MKKRIAVFTGTRADYGLLYWLIHELRNASDFELLLIVSGAHLSSEFGNTAKFIEEDGVPIADKIEILLSSDTPIGVAKSIGLATIGFADSLRRLAPDAIVLLGDRFEALAMAQTALIMRVPIVHLHGGEITEGAYDDAMRHAISKMASLHFTSCYLHRDRLISMGEEPQRVFDVGAVGLEHLSRSSLMNREELSSSLGFDVSHRPYFLVTYHPATAANEMALDSYRALLAALDQFPGYAKIITYPNADNGGRELIPLIEEYARLRPSHVLISPSIGQLRYLSAMAWASAVIGNSSSGIIEAPSCHVATVDIGDRQKGRTRAESVIATGTEKSAIVNAINVALSDEHQEKVKKCVNPYGSGEISRKILNVLRAFDLQTPKRFYDVSKEAS